MQHGRGKKYWREAGNKSNSIIQHKDIRSIVYITCFSASPSRIIVHISLPTNLRFRTLTYDIMRYKQIICNSKCFSVCASSTVLIQCQDSALTYFISELFILSSICWTSISDGMDRTFNNSTRNGRPDPSIRTCKYGMFSVANNRHSSRIQT